MEFRLAQLIITRGLSSALNCNLLQWEFKQRDESQYELLRVACWFLFRKVHQALLSFRHSLRINCLLLCSAKETLKNTGVLFLLNFSDTTEE